MVHLECMHGMDNNQARAKARQSPWQEAPRDELRSAPVKKKAKLSVTVMFDEQEPSASGAAQKQDKCKEDEMEASVAESIDWGDFKEEDYVELHCDSSEFDCEIQSIEVKELPKQEQQQGCLEDDYVELC